MSTLPFYRRMYARLFDPLLRLSLHGIAVDLERCAAERTKLLDACEHLQGELEHLVGADTCTCQHHSKYHHSTQVNIYEGMLKKDGKPRKPKLKLLALCHRCECRDFHPLTPPLHADKDLASPRIIHYLYRVLGLPPQRKREEKSLTADEIACRKLLLKVQAWKDRPTRGKQPPAKARWQHEPDFAIAVLSKILQHREQMKLSMYVNPENFDEDGRLRCQYKVTTESGRLASKSNPYKTGYNLQNIPRGGMRACFIPDEGCVLWSVDYSQAEYRLVKVISKDAEAIRQARLHPSQFDAYSAKAQFVFSKLLNCPESAIDVKVEVVPGTTRRQLIKPVILGIGYGEGGQKLQDSLLKDGVVLPLETCNKLLSLAREQYVLDYQKERRKRIMRHGELTSSWGRTLNLHGERLDDRTYRRGYAFSGATENADNLNQLGLIPLMDYIDDHRLRTHVNLQVHDELVGSSPLSELYDVLTFLIHSMEQERTYEGVGLSIPVGIKVGSTWACEFKWDTLPDRKVVEQAGRECLMKCKERRRRAA